MTGVTDPSEELRHTDSDPAAGVLLIQQEILDRFGGNIRSIVPEVGSIDSPGFYFAGAVELFHAAEAVPTVPTGPREVFGVRRPRGYGPCRCTHHDWTRSRQAHTGS